MSQFNVVSASSSFRPTRHAFELNFMLRTRIALSDDDGSIHHFGFSFVEAQRIISGELDPNILVDVIGRVYNMSQVHQSSPNDSKNKRVTVDIEDAAKTKMGITLWGSYADQIVNFVSKGCQGPVVIVCQFCKIEEYARTRSLSTSMYATRILINSDVEEITQFHKGLLPEDRNTPFNPFVGCALLTTSPTEAAFSGLALSPVDLLQHSGNGDVICVIAQVLQVNKEKGWYKIEVVVYDEFGIANLTVFDRNAFNYLGITATDLGAESGKIYLNVEDNDGWPKKLDSFVGKKFIFKVGIEVLEWNVFTFLTVQKMTDNPTILYKYSVHCLPQIDLTSVMDDLTTPDMNKSKQLLRGDGRRLSFHDVEASPSKETPSTCKRSATDLSDDGQSSGEFMMNIDDALKKVKIEKN
ncbi:replication protein A 70 kDa DNA-binding subunit C-like [Senna tora]|uniref:Replication protein A 70 kDa DNA-binding subunit C-like n=1 Tax=Senna tora TaxID=362788 RepID=A0A834X0D5_9FABA|nr:replication protein A 70 kDa DNA-binding subunit C-like [Senna tora]